MGVADKFNVYVKGAVVVLVKLKFGLFDVSDPLVTVYDPPVGTTTDQL